MSEMDKRVVRTQRLLGEALIALVLEQGYEPITIQDITDRADVGYRTFFRHYADKEALLMDVLREAVAELHALVGLSAGFVPRPQPLETGTAVFRHVQANEARYRALFRSGNVGVRPAVALVTADLVPVLGQFPGLRVPPVILANQLVRGMMSLIEWWLDNDLPYPPEQMGYYWAELMTGTIHHQLERMVKAAQ